MVFLIIISIGISALMIYIFIKSVNFIFNPIIRKLEKNLSTEESNCYITMHKLRRENDRQYQEYLKWMDENNASLPIEKLMTKEERSFENQINNILNNRVGR